MCVIIRHPVLFSFFFFFNATATTEIYTLSLHDALPIYFDNDKVDAGDVGSGQTVTALYEIVPRSEEHTSELQSPYDLVCRLLLEKKKKKQKQHTKVKSAIKSKTGMTV